MENLKTKKTNLLQIFYILGLITIIILLVVLPSRAMSTFLTGIQIWATKVLPALLPFFILTKLLSYTTFTKVTGKFLSPITNKLYGVGGVAGYIYIMSIMSGYPVGAKLTSDLYQDGKLSIGQAHTITSFTSTSGPLFIIGTVGIGMFHSQKLGIVVLISHYISALLNGLIYRNRKEINTQEVRTHPTTNHLQESMTNSIISIVVVGGFIAIFYMILSLLLSINAFSPIINLFSLFGIDKGVTSGIISGIIEVTSGVNMLSSCALSFEASAMLLSFFISFGGLSIHAQAYCFLKNFNMPYRKFLLQKMTHAIISTLVTFLVVLCI